MKLYYHPGACSLAVHIALIEAGLPHTLVGINREKRTSDGQDYLTVNPKGFVPALVLDDGTVLTEALAILVCVAETAGVLLPKAPDQRWRTLEALSFLTTELHGNFKPFYYREAEQADKARPKLIKFFDLLGDQLGDHPFLLGDEMTIADPYLVVQLMSAERFDIQIPDRMQAYFARIKEVPSVARALREEGLN